MRSCLSRKTSTSSLLVKKPSCTTAFRNGLKVQFPKERRYCASDEDLIVFCFGRLAWSNTLISSFELSLKDRQEFHSQIVNARQCFLGLMNAAQNPKRQGKKKDNEKSESVTEELSSSSRRASISETSINSLIGDTETPFEETSVDNLVSDPDMRLSASVTTRNGEADKLPNFHIGMHFERVMQEYGVLWNVNVLFGEDKHRFFKQAVLSTNHRKQERQLLVKAAILFTVVALLNGSFRHTDPEITLQMIRLKRNCPALLENLLFHGDRSQTDDQESTNNCLLESHSYLKPAVRGKLKLSCVQNQGLPTRITNSTELRFRQLMQTAMTGMALMAFNGETSLCTGIYNAPLLSGQPANVSHCILATFFDSALAHMLSFDKFILTVYHLRILSEFSFGFDR